MNVVWGIPSNVLQKQGKTWIPVIRGVLLGWSSKVTSKATPTPVGDIICNFFI